MAEDRQVFVYKGVEYNLPSSFTPEQAKARILQHLGESQPEPTKQSTAKPSQLDEFIAGAKGTGAFTADVLAGMLKIPASAALAVGGKLADPSMDLQTHWKSAQQAMEDTFPSFGSGLEENLGYSVPMKPFELYGKGIEKLASTAGKTTGSPDVEGAINVGGQFLPIPFAGKVPKAISKISEKLSESKKVVPDVKPRDITAIEKALTEVPPEVKQLPPPELVGPPYDPNLPIYKEAARQRQIAEKAKTKVDVPIEGGETPPTIRVGADGTAYPATFENEVARRAAEARMQAELDAQYADPFNRMARELAPAEEIKPPVQPVDPFEQIKQQALEAGNQQRYAQAQAAIEARQKQLEFETARQALLDRNAAERARQEAATTGREAWEESLRQSAEQRIPGNNEPINFTNEPSPYSLAEPPYKHTGGLDFTDFAAEDLSRNIVKQGEIREAFKQREAERSLEQQKQRALEEQQQALEERLMPLEERLREEAHQPPTREELRAERGRPGKAGMYRNSQRGALDFQAISEVFQKILNLNKYSPSVKDAMMSLTKQSKEERVKNILGSTSGYVENIRTPAEVIAASENAKDIPASALLGAKTVTPGSNALAIKHPNPLIKFLRYGKNEINHFVTSASERYITSKDGIGVIIKKLSPKELTEAVQLLQLGDRKQMKITEEIMRKNGYSANQIEFVNKFYEMDKFKLDLWNRKLDEAGMPLVESREGHMPGIFKGDFKQLVLDKNNKPIGFIGVDFKWQLEAARKKMLERFPDAKFTEVSRSKLGGSGVQKAHFGEMQEVLKMLAEHDPAFAEVQKQIEVAIKENSNAAYGAAYHAMKKKGIVGNEGNKPWLDAERNAKDFVKAYLQHWEEGVTSHVMLPFERDMRALMQNPELKNSERAKEYVNEYIKNMTGRSVGDVGQALNTLLDAPFKLTGLGKSTPKEIVNQLNKRAGQWTMGFGNVLYTLTQYIQVAQSALPEMQSMAKQLKIPLGEVTPAFTKAVSQLASHYLGKESPADATVFKEARDRGLLTFSEFSDINKITQNKHSAAFDKAVDFSRNELGERPTRPVVFFAAVDVLKRQGLEGKVLYDTAYNMTQAAMIDYHAWERPMMYSSAGVTGNLAGTLATYKHGYLNQLNRFASEARKGNVMPLISAATMLFAFAGLRGIPGYDDLNSVVEYMTEKFGGKRQNISEITMSNLPEWAKSGALSASTNVNMQGRLSTANVLPDSPIEAISPWASFYGKIGSAAGDVISNRDELSLRNLGATLLPSGPLKGIGERALNTDDQGYLLDKHGLKGNERSEWDKDVRLFTGGTSLSQSLTSTNQYMSTKRLKGYKETQKGIIQDLERKYVQGTLTDEDTKEAAKKFIDAKGDPEQLVESMIKYATTVKLNKQQRLQGIPNGSLSSLYKYQEYSDDVVR